MMPEDRASYVSPPPISTEGPADMPPIFNPGYAAVLDYLMKLEIPKEYQDEFNQYKPALSQALKLAYIPRDQVGKFVIMFQLILDYYKIGLPLVARKRMSGMLVELMLTGSVEGFWSKLMFTSRREQVLEGFNIPEERKEKKGFWIFKR